MIYIVRLRQKRTADIEVDAQDQAEALKKARRMVARGTRVEQFPPNIEIRDSGIVPTYAVEKV